MLTQQQYGKVVGGRENSERCCQRAQSKLRHRRWTRSKPLSRACRPADLPDKLTCDAIKYKRVKCLRAIHIRPAGDNIGI